MIPLCRPAIGAEEESAVSQVLRSGMLVQGKRVIEFEQQVAQRCDRDHAIAICNGTAALRLSLQAIGIGKGDQVLCPNLTWPSPAHAILDCGAEPVLVDVDEQLWNVTPALIKKAITPQTRAAIVIDQFGNPASVAEIAKELKDIPLIVDAACSLGSHIASSPCGSLGLIACCSFHPRKIITTGEGGMCLTDDPVLAKRLRILRNHGQSNSGVFEAASSNYRMTDIAAAMGIVQLSRLDELVEERRKLARGYQSRLPQNLFQKSLPGCTPNYQTLGFVLPPSFQINRRDEIIADLAQRGIQAGLLSFALHRLAPLKRYSVGTYRASEAVVDRGIALPLYPGMRDSDLEKVTEALLEIIEKQ